MGISSQCDDCSRPVPGGVGDGEPGESTATEFHTNFRLASGTGSVVLSRELDGKPQILDYLNFAGVPEDWTYGSLPNGQPFYRDNMYYATPGGPNNAASPPLVVYINEWMAANTSASGFADPADGNYDDWFELYNPGSTSVALGGYYLTDDLVNRFKFRIPEGYNIAPQGFLLVWADNDTNQNSPVNPDLHANFKLSQSGETIGLYASDGTIIDAVAFGTQTNNVSEGHYPDGTGPLYFMTTPTPRAANELATPVEPPQVSEVRLSPEGMISFSFDTVAGATYRVEYKDDLNDPTWHPLTADQVADGSVQQITDDANVNPHRFYRVVVQ